ncbi:peptidoglycan DD-metalloendopeptidase family protein [Wukongibacter baidiensis]|uniref:peptidoglycan DD-metalloendopeptidase family protein n=1 Tax=Wukongibacter baidiensis TaxID=1723361 RepID=UPI003D7F9384
MTNSGNSDGLKKEILKMMNKVKDDSKLRTLLIASSVCVLIFVMVFASNGNSKELAYNKLASATEVQGTVLASNADTAEVHRTPNRLSDIEDTVNEILTISIPAYAVNVGGEDLAVFQTKEEAEVLLDDIIQPYINDEEVSIEDVGFKEDVKIVEKAAKPSELQDVDEYEDILYYITKGTNETKIHKIEKGENFWVIAKKYKISVDSLVKANPEVKPERIQIGQEISLVVPKPLLTVVTKEIKEYTEYIAFETEYEDTNVLYKGEYRVKKAGKKGERDVVAEISKQNGIEVSRSIIEENITEEPVTKLVLKGTKDPPPRIGTGKFAKPTSRGIVTSPFGMRWGRRHTGIDIGLKTGTPVTAADGGKVIYSGYKGGYGKCIIIDHGANMKTLYAHNSALVVKKGDKVFKGQTIAKSGNTGNSTGPHLHFEVRINDTPVNPTKYVKY